MRWQIKLGCAALFLASGILSYVIVLFREHSVMAMPLYVMANVAHYVLFLHEAMNSIVAPLGWALLASLFSIFHSYLWIWVLIAASCIISGMIDLWEKDVFTYKHNLENGSFKIAIGAFLFIAFLFIPEGRLFPFSPPGYAIIAALIAAPIGLLAIFILNALLGIVALPFVLGVGLALNGGDAQMSGVLNFLKTVA